LKARRLNSGRCSPVRGVVYASTNFAEGFVWSIDLEMDNFRYVAEKKSL
jgi:hypothetical protein